MDTQELLDRLEEAVMLRSDDAAIRIQATYGAQAGAHAKVYPPTYMPSDGTRYHLEKRWGPDGEERDVVVVDSVQSQANRAEAALSQVAQGLSLPRLLMVVELEDRTIELSSLDAPHRSRDAYFLDSELDGVPFDKTDVGQALNAVTPKNATAALRYAPYDLIYGVWDSHRGKRVALRFPRVYTSEMLGWDVLPGKRAATKGDPFNLPGRAGVPLQDWRPDAVSGQRKKAEVVLNELGHGMIPSAPEDEAGGVSVTTITRSGVLSLTGLAGVQFPLDGGEATAAGRVALAALALLADRLAFARAGLHLRSGSDLVLVDDRLEWVRVGDVTEPLELDRAGARALLDAARKRLAAAGVIWSSEAVVLEPSVRLRRVIEQTFYVPELDV